MIAVDTNVLVRLLTHDDPAQAEIVSRVMEEHRVWVAKTVLLETAWVLQSVHEFPAEQVIQGLRKLAGLKNVELEEPLQVARALEWCESGLDFADALHVASRSQRSRFATFDKRLMRRARRAGVPEVIVLR